jgi:hypothetical protein
MTAVFVGTMALDGAIPGAGVAAEAGIDGINAAIPDLSARMASLAAAIQDLTLAPPPNFADMLSRAVQLQTQIALAIATPGLIPPPDFGPALIALQALLGSLQVTLGDLDAKVNLIAGFQDLLAAAGVHVVAFTGPIGSFGSEVSAALGGPIPSGNAYAVVLATTSGATWAAMSQVLRVTP